MLAERGYLAYMNMQLVPDRLTVDEFNDYASAVFSRRHKLVEEDPAPLPRSGMRCCRGWFRRGFESRQLTEGRRQTSMTEGNQPQTPNDNAKRSLIDLTSEEARTFLLKQESYCSIDLPSYFQFDNLLEDVTKLLEGKNVID